ncbi:unnamed protein product [Ilex paraguariensis]|uniref:Exopolygalacturonase-like n=1 Tax=Ilex paraguariensis TaxID=185542 RepID=A0ABC8QL80_9AQUA
MGLKISFSSIVLLLLLTRVVEGQPGVFDVTKFGAKPDADIGPALVSAWKEACASVTPSTILIPKNNYALSQVLFEGPCKSSINFQIQGTVKASGDPSAFKANGPGLPGWVTFEHVDLLTVSGGGTFDGQGATAWSKNDCQTNSNCAKLPISLVFNFVTNSVAQDITSLNSKNFHLQVFGADNMTVQHVTITAPGDSPNTDGIHVGRSTKVTINDTQIGTGDDCISIGDGTQQLTIEKVTCGPGHGISVGSLGKFPEEKEVVGVFVRNCTLTNTLNGVRIKTWPASLPGSASDMHFEDIIVNNVGNPVMIDQEYCPSNQCSKKAPSRVKVSKVSFKNIKGTSSTQLAVKLLCSESIPCENVEVGDIDLAYSGPEGPPTTICSNVKPIFSGKQNPPTCVGGSQSS